jgi:serine/threonine protein kinase
MSSARSSEGNNGDYGEGVGIPPSLGSEVGVPELKLESSIVDDRYQVEGCLGRGSYAEIFLARDVERAREPVIIKALNTTLQGTLDADLEWTLIENFQNEAIALDKVRHPNVIRRLGHGTAADLVGTAFHYLVLEYMAGGDLLSLCRNRPLKLAEVKLYFEQVARALANAHAHRVIHRDIKPNNLLLSEDRSVVKIADFGVAKMTPDDHAEITRVGTSVYAPPEHHPDSANDEMSERLTPSADVYSFAKTLYTALTGRAPRQFARQPITELPEALTAESWGPSLLEALSKATATRVADRFQTIEELWECIARLAETDETDPEATLVRARLGARSEVIQPAARPEFQPLAPLRSQHGGTQPARIVVELPRREPADRAGISTEAPAAAVAVEAKPSDVSGPPPDRLMVSRRELAAEIARRAASDDNRTPVFERLRRVVNSDWLRRAFILFLIAALTGLAASTYYYFAGGGAPFEEAVSGEDGLVAGAPNVNLRSDPSRQGAVMAVLPEGTRVRAFESRDGWRRVKVLEWPGSAPDNAVGAGWVDNRFIRLD